ncbi:MAG: hypothetical protein ACN6O7_02485 [Sphingobacterium sp.]
MKKAIDWVKEAFEGQRIESIYLYNTSQGVCIGGIEVESGDLLLFNKNKSPVKIAYKPASWQESDDILELLSKMELGEKKTIVLKHIDPFKLREMAIPYAAGLRHNDPYNVVKIDGNTCTIDFT